jgi:hypothetical protein
MVDKPGLTLKEDNRLRMLQKRAPRTAFGPDTEEVIGAWRKLH